MQRRRVLQAGAVALGTALLPRAGDAAEVPATRGQALEALRADYMRRVREVAERLRPALAHAQDLDRERHWDLRDKAAYLLEGECQAVFCPTERDAQLVLGLSRYWEEDNIFEFDDRLLGVSTVAALVAEALEARWYFDYRRVEVRP